MALPCTRTAYAPPRSTGRIDLKLDGNEGRAPAPELLERAMKRLICGTPEAIERYPDTTQLEQLLAQLSGVSRDRIFVGAGADDVLERITRHLTKGRFAVTTPPTFEMIPRYLEEAEIPTAEVTWREGPFPTEQVIEAARAREADLVFAVSPNNPSGATLTSRDLQTLAESLPESLIVLDLVYGEFAAIDL
ncbi:MAG: aminotransferase class I/II-fold pyridoxal phosphate-dependent enzyme, partial [Planctomycetota bacterium]